MRFGFDATLDIQSFFNAVSGFRAAGVSKIELPPSVDVPMFDDATPSDEDAVKASGGDFGLTFTERVDGKFAQPNGETVPQEEFLKSPDGSNWAVSVGDDGALVTKKVS